MLLSSQAWSILHSCRDWPCMINRLVTRWPHSPTDPLVIRSESPLSGATVMMKAKSVWMMSASALLVVLSLAFMQSGGILFPDWSPPTKGTYDSPAGEVGKQVKDAQPWSVTTVTSAI